MGRQTSNQSCNKNNSSKFPKYQPVQQNNPTDCFAQLVGDLELNQAINDVIKMDTGYHDSDAYYDKPKACELSQPLTYQAQAPRQQRSNVLIVTNAAQTQHSTSSCSNHASSAMHHHQTQVFYPERSTAMRNHTLSTSSAASELEGAFEHESNNMNAYHEKYSVLESIGFIRKHGVKNKDFAPEKCLGNSLIQKSFSDRKMST